MKYQKPSFSVPVMCNFAVFYDYDYDDDDGLPAYSHQSYSHQVGICHNDEGWEYDTVTFQPCINPSSINRKPCLGKVIVQLVPKLNSSVRRHNLNHVKCGNDLAI